MVSETQTGPGESKELRLAPGTFALHVRGHFRGVLAVHVDDVRMAFHPLFEHILDKLKDVFKFGEWQDAMSQKVKFCGRWESQDPKTFKVTVTMDGYAPKLRDPPQRASQDRVDRCRTQMGLIGGGSAELDGPPRKS